MENKEELAQAYEAQMKSVKTSNTYVSGFLGGVTGGFGGLVAGSVLGLSSGGAAFLLVGAAAGVAAVGAYIGNKISEKEMNADKEAMKNMSEEEVVDFKAKSVADVQKMIGESRKKAEEDSPSLTGSIVTIGMMGS